MERATIAGGEGGGGGKKAKFTSAVSNAKTFYQSSLISTELFQHDLINVSCLTACYLYQAGHDDVALFV